MTTHNQFPLLPGSRKCSSSVLWHREEKNHRSKWKRVAVFCAAAATTGASGWDREVKIGETGWGGRKSSEEQNTWDERARTSDRHGAEVEWPEGKSLVWSGSLAWQRGGGRSRGRVSYLDRVLSAKCFCWLSACLEKNKTKQEMNM